MTRICLRSFSILIIAIALMNPEPGTADEPARLCRVNVVDEENGWPVPLVELRTTNQVRYVTDNNGVIAIDDPSLFGREVWFHVSGHGYEVPLDGFGYRGVRLIPRAGATLTVQVKRTSIAKRIGRLTGAGLFAESQKLGEEADWKESGVFGCDSVQNAVYQGRLYWAWGDTNVAGYPLGVFHMTSATTSLQPFALQPPLRPEFDYYVADDGRPSGVANMPGSGPTWLTGYVSLPDHRGEERLVAIYRKIKPPLETYEAGLCVWSDRGERFEHLLTIWKKADGQPAPAIIAEGHPVFWTDDQQQRWVLFGNPLPKVRVPATFEAWQDPTQWESLSPPDSLLSAEDQSPVQLHSGSIAWSPFRQRWVTVFMQKFGQPSAFGTLWYAESESPIGDFGPAVKILSHDNYTFYNPRLHPEFTDDDNPALLFEGTYTTMFSGNQNPTPRYEYNQILYRLDLDDPALQPASNR